MTTADVTTLAIALGICFAAYKWLPGGPIVKAAAVGVGATIIARQLPYVGPALGNGA